MLDCPKRLRVFMRIFIALLLNFFPFLLISDNCFFIFPSSFGFFMFHPLIGFDFPFEGHTLTSLDTKFFRKYDIVSVSSSVNMNKLAFVRWVDIFIIYRNAIFFGFRYIDFILCSSKLMITILIFIVPQNWKWKNEKYDPNYEFSQRVNIFAAAVWWATLLFSWELCW